MNDHAETHTIDAAERSDYGFQADVARLLELMTHSVYSERDIFLRELVSNAADAIEKLRYRSAGERRAGGAGRRAARHHRARQGRAHAERHRQWRRHVARGSRRRARHHRELRHARLSRRSRDEGRRSNEGRRALHRPLRHRLLFGLHGRRSHRGGDAPRRLDRSLSVDLGRQGLVPDRAARRSTPRPRSARA